MFRKVGRELAAEREFLRSIPDIFVVVVHLANRFRLVDSGGIKSLNSENCSDKNSAGEGPLGKICQEDRPKPRCNSISFGTDSSSLSIATPN